MKPRIQTNRLIFGCFLLTTYASTTSTWNAVILYAWTKDAHHIRFLPTWPCETIEKLREHEKSGCGFSGWLSNMFDLDWEIPVLSLARFHHFQCVCEFKIFYVVSSSI